MIAISFHLPGKLSTGIVRLLGSCCLIAATVCTSSAQTGSPEPVRELDIVLSGVDKVLRQNIEGFLEIWSFNQKPIPSVPRLRFLHKRATEQIEAALRPFGYYRPVIESELIDVGSKWRAIYRVDPRDRVRITSQPVIDLTGVEVDCDDFRYRPRDRKSLLPEIAVKDDDFNKHRELVLAFCAARATAGLIEGRPLNQQSYDALKQTMQTTAARFGYFDAVFTSNEIRIDVEDYSAAVALVMQPGERYRISDAVINQDIDWIEGELLERYVELEDQDYFDAGKLQALQSDLTNSEYYKRVEVKATVQEASDNVVPVKVDLTHIKPREYVVGIGYGTDTGARIKIGVDGRRVNRRGHHYTAEGRLSEIGYGLFAGYTIPAGDPRTDSFGVRVGIERENSSVRNYHGFSIGGSYQYRDDLWFKTYAIDYSVDDFILDNESTISRLLMPSIEWTRTFPQQLEKRINTVNGSWFRFGLRGAAESLLSDTSFIQPSFSSKLIKSFTTNHRLILRAGAGTTWVEDYEKLPLSLRYYAGGDASVRGFDYQVIAPLNGDNKPQGAKHLLEASAEYEIPFRGNFSVAAFTDFGDAFDDKPEYRVGAGVGLRWRSPIGPVRFDIARKMNDPGEGGVRVHLSLGPDL